MDARDSKLKPTCVCFYRFCLLQCVAWKKNLFVRQTSRSKSDTPNEDLDSSHSLIKIQAI